MRQDDYGISLAWAVSKKSKDPSSKVGAVIFRKDGTIVSTGYNGMIKGAKEAFLSYERPAKYLQIIHAEMNALIFARQDLRGCTVYITHSPCENCLKHMIQAGVERIVYDDNVIMATRSTGEQKNAIYSLLKATGVEVRNLNGKYYLQDLGLI